jgi:hypothetical protein
VSSHDVAYAHAMVMPGVTTTQRYVDPSIGSTGLFCKSRYLHFIQSHPAETRSINHGYSSSSRDGNVNHIVDPDPRLGPSGEITRTAYVGPASLGLTNLLLREPTAPAPAVFALLKHAFRLCHSYLFMVHGYYSVTRDVPRAALLFVLFR